MGCYQYHGVRFTPSASQCWVKKARVFTDIVSGPSKVCSLLVYSANGQQPGTQSTSVTFMPVSEGWVDIDIPAQPSYSDDFFLVVWLDPDDNMALCEDRSRGHGDRMVCAVSRYSWKVSSEPGDYMIRAVVSYVGTEEARTSPRTTELHPVFPNPAVDRCLISYTLADRSEVALKVYDISGKEVRTLTEGFEEPGLRKIEWNNRDNHGKEVSPGIYFCKLTSDGSEALTRRMVILSR